MIGGTVGSMDIPRHKVTRGGGREKKAAQPRLRRFDLELHGNGYSMTLTE